jgi:hypothetical protein
MSLAHTAGKARGYGKVGDHAGETLAFRDFVPNKRDGNFEVQFGYRDEPVQREILRYA